MSRTLSPVKGMRRPAGRLDCNPNKRAADSSARALATTIRELLTASRGLNRFRGQKNGPSVDVGC
jgi:hypothetical protein